MEIKRAKDVAGEVVTMEGVSGTTIQWIFGPADEAPTFAMRRFVMAPGGRIPLHGHPWEHEIFVLSGRAEVFTDRETRAVGAGEAILVRPDEPHGYLTLGEEPFEFLCIVPNSAVP